MADSAKMDRIKVETAQLTIGMYVAELDRPWTDTNFLFRVFAFASSKRSDCCRKSVTTFGLMPAVRLECKSN